MDSVLCCSVIITSCMPGYGIPTIIKVLIALVVNCSLLNINFTMPIAIDYVYCLRMYAHPMFKSLGTYIHTYAGGKL